MSGRNTAIARAKQVREVMLDYGVPEVSIEVLPGRPTSGDVWNALDPFAVFSHHIASHPHPANPVPGLNLVKKGHGSLPGPLCNGTAGVDLVYRIITLGLANHPGYGGPLKVSGPLGTFVIPKDNARAYAWGTEYEGGYSESVWDTTYLNRRTGKRMTYREFMGRCNAALVEAIWLPGLNSRGKKPTRSMDLSGYHGEHKTWAPGRKPDRLGYSTESGRAEIRKFKSVEEDDMEYTDWSEGSKKALVNDILGTKVRVRKNAKGDRQQITIKQAIARAANGTMITRESENDIIEAMKQSDADNEEGTD